VELVSQFGVVLSRTFLLDNQLAKSSMSSNADSSDAQSANLPFVKSVVRRIVEELFNSQSQWKSGDLADRAIQLHQTRSGLGSSNPRGVLRRVFDDLKNDGLVVAPAPGWLRWSCSGAGDLQLPDQLPTDGAASVDDVVDDLEPTIKIETEVGAGPECVYLYFNPNDRQLAELKGRDVWECKIGRTAGFDAINRILAQGIRTALSRLPIVGLVLRTDDSAALENALHASLRLVGAEVPDSPGNEWFFTSPARTQAWYMSFQNALTEIRPQCTNLG
jgi:hypothetical protein